MSSQVWVFEQVQPTLACIATEAIILTCLYNLHSLTRHFYIVKVGLTCVHLFFIFALIHRMWLLIRAASLKEFYPVPTIYFLEQKKKNIYFFFL